jgi:hypothetical protein
LIIKAFLSIKTTINPKIPAKIVIQIRLEVISTQISEKITLSWIAKFLQVDKFKRRIEVNSMYFQNWCQKDKVDRMKTIGRM